MFSTRKNAVSLAALAVIGCVPLACSSSRAIRKRPENPDQACAFGD